MASVVEVVVVFDYAGSNAGVSHELFKCVSSQLMSESVSNIFKVYKWYFPECNVISVSPGDNSLASRGVASLSLNVKKNHCKNKPE